MHLNTWEKLKNLGDPLFEDFLEHLVNVYVELDKRLEKLEEQTNTHD